MLNLVIRFFKDNKLTKEQKAIYQPEAGWYVCQNYFNDFYKDQLLTDPEVDAITIYWENKNYVFKTR